MQFNRLDLARIGGQTLQLRPINLDQAEALWAMRMAPLHAESEAKPETLLLPYLGLCWSMVFLAKKNVAAQCLGDLGRELIAYYKHHGQMPRRSKPFWRKAP